LEMCIQKTLTKSKQKCVKITNPLAIRLAKPTTFKFNFLYQFDVLQKEVL